MVKEHHENLKNKNVIKCVLNKMSITFKEDCFQNSFLDMIYRLFLTWNKINFFFYSDEPCNTSAKYQIS